MTLTSDNFDRARNQLLRRGVDNFNMNLYVGGICNIDRRDQVVIRDKMRRLREFYKRWAREGEQARPEYALMTEWNNR